MGVSGSKWDEVERRAKCPAFRALKERVEHMFLGQYHHTLDEKGRLTIPSAFREALTGGAFLSQGFDRNLMVMTADYFQQVYQRINAMSITDPAARLLRRLLLSSAYQVEVDKSGRILLPQTLREFIGSEAEAMVVGQGEYFEIWTPAEWSLQMQTLQDADANAGRFQTLNLSTGA
ncbi:MAG: division/cell wall cluster transcriptional repressor MraZ [Anaerolineae bacterium CG_4_9_14_3_um_filter_57_17]|nr:MAG: division/cell wall cluster transcriptional repressor MraZ [Anaerolineae bacterium CG_4_9_14_3_um_filter_57_17]